MLTEQERTSIIDFYGQQIEQIAAEEGWELLIDLDRSIGYVVLGNDLDNGYLYIDRQEPPVDWSVGNFIYKVIQLPDAIKIKRPDASTVPEPVIEAFNRHIWYSRYCLADIRLVSFEVIGCKTFALYIQGYVDGRWMNSTRAWEIYEASGAFVCSLIESGTEWRCKEGVLSHEDFDESSMLEQAPPPYPLEFIAQSPSPIQMQPYGDWGDYCQMWYMKKIKQRPCWLLNRVVDLYEPHL